MVQPKAPRSTCRAARKDGLPCSAPAVRNGFCFSHDPDLAEARAAARRLGGEARATHRRLMRLAPPELRELVERLLVASAQVHEGRLDPRRAHAMAALARAAAAVYQQAELTARLERLEGLLGGGAPWTSLDDWSGP